MSLTVICNETVYLVTIVHALHNQCFDEAKFMWFGRQNI